MGFNKNLLPQSNKPLPNNFINTLWDNGYPTASIDSIKYNNDSTYYYIHIGSYYKWLQLNNIKAPTPFLNQIGYDVTTFKQKPVSSKTIAILANTILNYCDRNGYPFAKVYLDSITNTQSGLVANLAFDKGMHITIDSIDIQGDAEINYNYIQSYLGIKAGDNYNIDLLKDISKKIALLPFVREAKPWSITYGVSNSIISLYLENKNANSADVLVGLQPNTSNVGNKFFLTGDIKLALINSLRNGESLQLNWQNLQYKSPRLNIEIVQPYIFKTLLGVNAKFNYNKQDTTFRNVAGELGVFYQASAYNFFKLYYSQNNVRTITLNTSNIILQNKLPQSLDFNLSNIGVEWTIDNTNYKPNPTKGYGYTINTSVGIKNIIKNLAITELTNPFNGKKLDYLYDSVQLKSNRLSIKANAQYYIPFTKKAILKLAYNSGYLYNVNLLQNELYQIGGYKLLRGYDEASLFVKEFHILSIEPKLVLNKQSYIYSFCDISKLKRNAMVNNTYINALGVGAGLVLQTKNGAFNILYGIGNNLGNGFQFSNSKLHFGYLNSF